MIYFRIFPIVSKKVGNKGEEEGDKEKVGEDAESGDDEEDDDDEKKDETGSGSGITSNASSSSNLVSKAAAIMQSVDKKLKPATFVDILTEVCFLSLLLDCGKDCLGISSR